MKLLTQLKDFKFVTILLLVFKKIGNKDKKKEKSMAISIQAQKQKYFSRT